MSDQNTGGGLAQSGQSKGGHATAGGISPPSLDQMLGLWTAWMEQVSAAPQAAQSLGWPQWPKTPGTLSLPALPGSADQLGKSLASDPLLRSLDQIWNANPLREVVPVDWAEIAWALRTVWLRSAGKPKAAMSLVEFNQGLWRSFFDAWQEAGQRWLGLFGLTKDEEPAAGSTDKRFAAPEWRTNPAYHAL